jgi:hypothetical protein
VEVGVKEGSLACLGRLWKFIFEFFCLGLWNGRVGVCLLACKVMSLGMGGFGLVNEVEGNQNLFRRRLNG